jgi:hypothetical protein
LEDDFWMSALEKLLPGTWVKAGEITDKAAKANDAKIHTACWTNVLCSFYPLSPARIWS